MRLRRLLALAAILSPLPNCGGDPFSSGDGASGENAVAGSAGRSSGGAAGTSSGGAAGEPVEPRRVEIEVAIANDADDATWIAGTDERLKFAPDDLNLEVGTDEEMGRMGFRFELPIPPGAEIESARLRLYRVDGDALATETLQVRVYDSISVEPFDDAHVHAAEAHVSEGLWSRVVSGFAVGTKNAQVESPDLGELVQHLIDSPGWSEGSSIGFVVLPDQMAGWASYTDSSAAAGQAALRVVYLER